MNRMSSATFRLVLLVSCAHAMVHMFEHSLPAVEQLIGDEFGVGRERTGILGTVWRLPFGLGAMLAGWLADRYGSKQMLMVYLLGCMMTAVLAWWAPTLAILTAVMFTMGCFASIYHPAGLALISRETTPETRGAALGWHGIFGSIGIAASPFLAALVFGLTDITWRQFYLVLAAIPIVLLVALQRATIHPNESHRSQSGTQTNSSDGSDTLPIPRYLTLVAAGALSGFVYAAFLHFLPRYLDDTGLRPEDWSKESFRNTLTTAALLCAAVGQGIAGRIAAPGKLEYQLIAILGGNVPPLVWMAFADGASRFVAACCLAFVHFMNQPIYNSLIAQMIPARRRSLGFGFSNMACFGVGAFGPLVAGMLRDERTVYLTLAATATCAAGLAVLLRQLTSRSNAEG